MIKLELPWPPKSLSTNGSHGHWAPKAKAKASYRAECGWRAKAQLPAGLSLPVPLHVKYTFAPPDAHSRDEGNMISAFKAGQDGLADALGIDDKHFRCTYAFDEPHRPCGLITVEITRHKKREPR